MNLLLLLSACGSIVQYPDDGHDFIPAPTPSPDSGDTASDDTAPDDSGGTVDTTGGDTSETAETADTSVDTDTGGSAYTPPAVSTSAYTGTWAPSSTPTELGVGVHPWHVATADVDGDGRTDLVYSWNVSSWGGDELHLVTMFQDSTGALSTSVNLDVGHDTAFSGSFRAADLDGDGDADLVAGHDDGVTVFLSDGAGGFSAGTDYLAGDGTTVRTGDLDGDGDVDLLALGTDGTLQVWLGDGTGSFTAGYADTDETGEIGQSLALLDIDGDGDLDYATGSASIGSTPDVLFHGVLNDGSGNFDVGSPVASPSDLPMVTNLVVHDLNDDGFDDLIGAGARGDTFDMTFGGWLGSGTAAFGSYFDFMTVASTGITGIAFGDLDGDGDDDVFASNALYRTGYFGFDDGGGAWSTTTVDLGLWYESDVYPDTVAVGDLDGDGCGDLVWRTDVDVVVAPGTGC